MSRSGRSAATGGFGRKGRGKLEPGESPVGNICSCTTQIRMIEIGHHNYYYFNQNRALINRSFAFWMETVILSQQIYFS